jgi:hypothetical protein
MGEGDVGGEREGRGGELVVVGGHAPPIVTGRQEQGSQGTSGSPRARVAAAAQASHSPKHPPPLALPSPTLPSPARNPPL